MSKKAQVKSQDKSLERKTIKEEDAAEVQRCIERLRELLQGEKKLRIKVDDKFLLRYLRWLHFDPDKAFNKMKDIHKFRAEKAEWHCRKPPSEYEDILALNVQVMLGDRDRRGRRVYLVKIGNIDTNHVTIYPLTHVDDLWLEMAMEEEETQKNGLAIIVDMEGYSWKLFRWLTPQNINVGLRKFYNLTFQSIDIHVVNTSFLLNTSIALVFPFLDSKTKEHIHFHNTDWPSLHKHINPEILPQEYGGHVPSIDYVKLRSVLYDNSENLMELFSMGYVNT
jgi:hypothetical protein